ncbi:Peptidyl-prolyl cis-trans isomerase fkbp12 [Phytophthora boehmeriae]|uniref:peptidylprolyl isomerase n=1 Tax=Phytophthora boehmeriae TaxID=109152 RepID=A0A8T1WSD8_9STRA|nr:Peptidyl-prolyl cis-trans isomerase fkbp12 [Phytophthora boehmeriae]
MGVTKEIIAEGNGAPPAKGATVTVHCTGYGKDRDLQQKFWSTKDPGQTPFTFNVGLGQVIKGWDEGVLGMKLGETARLTCTPDYAKWLVSLTVVLCTIQPDSTLLFEIEVLKIE